MCCAGVGAVARAEVGVFVDDFDRGEAYTVKLCAR